MTTRLMSAVTALAMLLIAALWQPAGALPAFARKYKTSCSTCHYAFPKLNAFGRAFRANGFRFPGGDEDFLKEKPVKLGGEGQKAAFPGSIWPADIAGTSPISVVMTSRLHFNENSPNTSFEFPHELAVVASGTVGESFSYLAELEVEHADELATNLFIQYDYRPQLHIKVGSIDPMPIPDGRRLTKSHYGFGSIRAISKSNSGGNARWRFRNTQSGISIWGRTNGLRGRGGARYEVGLLNGQNDIENNDVNSSKDFFVNGSYKLGGLGEIGGTEGGASTSSAFWLDNSARIGGYFYTGKSKLAGFDDRFYVGGTNWDLWYSRLNVFGTFLYQRDNNINTAGTELTTKAWFTEGDLVIFPWLIGLERFEWTKVGNGNTADKTLISGLALMGRANTRFTLQAIIPTNRRGARDYEYVIQFDMAI